MFFFSSFASLHSFIPRLMHFQADEDNFQKKNQLNKHTIEHADWVRENGFDGTWWTQQCGQFSFERFELTLWKVQFYTREWTPRFFFSINFSLLLWIFHNSSKCYCCSSSGPKHLLMNLQSNHHWKRFVNNSHCLLRSFMRFMESKWAKLFAKINGFSSFTSLCVYVSLHCDSNSKHFHLIHFPFALNITKWK